MTKQGDCGHLTFLCQDNHETSVGVMWEWSKRHKAKIWGYCFMPNINIWLPCRRGRRIYELRKGKPVVDIQMHELGVGLEVIYGKGASFLMMVIFLKVMKYVEVNPLHAVTVTGRMQYMQEETGYAELGNVSPEFSPRNLLRAVK